MNDPQKEAAYRVYKEEKKRVWYAHSHEQQLRWGRWYAELNQRRRRVDKELRKQVLERDRNTCRYCGTPLLREKEIHIDHVHPFSKDGETIIDNLVASCRECNKAKSYLHGIKPMALDKLPRWNLEDCKTALAKSTQRRKKLMREWENLAQAPAQHDLGAVGFSHRYDAVLRLGLGSQEAAVGEKLKTKWVELSS